MAIRENGIDITRKVFAKYGARQRVSNDAELGRIVGESVLHKRAKQPRLQANGIPKSLQAFKKAHRNGEQYDPDMLTKLRMEKMALPGNSANGTDMALTPNQRYGSVDASTSNDDEGNGWTTKPSVFGGQAVTNISSANDPRILDAIKQCMLNPRPLMS